MGRSMAVGLEERRWRHIQAADCVSALAADAAQGDREDVLSRAACQLAGLPEGRPDDTQIIDVLLAAASHTDLLDCQAVHAIRSGIYMGRRRLQQLRADAHARRAAVAAPPPEMEPLVRLAEGGGRPR